MDEEQEHRLIDESLGHISQFVGFIQDHPLPIGYVGPDGEMVPYTDEQKKGMDSLLESIPQILGSYYCNRFYMQENENLSRIRERVKGEVIHFMREVMA